MRAVIKPRPGPGLELVEVPNPRVGQSDVLIKVQAASICGSDIPIYNWDDAWVRETIKPGQIIGHEFCGTVIDIGKEVYEIFVGDFVTAEGHLNCGRCFHCQIGEAHLCPTLKLIGFDYPGAFAEYISVPKSNVIRLQNLPMAIAAIQDSFGNAVHAAMRTQLASATVLITGCGPLGLMIIALAKFAGAHRVYAIDTSQYRLNLAMKMGTDIAMNPNEVDFEELIRQETVSQSGVDVLFEMSGAPQAISQGFKLIRNGGQAILMGLPKEPVSFDLSNDLIVKGITVHGLCGRLMYKTWHQTQKFLEVQADGTRPIDLLPLITHRLTIDDFEQGIALMKARQCGKIILLIDQAQ